MNILKKIKNSKTTNIMTTFFYLMLSILLLLALFTLVTCSSKKPETLVTTLDNNQENINESQILQLTETENTESTSSPQDNDYNSQDNGNNFNDTLFLEDQDNLDIPSNLLERIKRNLLIENYPAVINLVEDRDDDASTYYHGIAYFVMMQEQHKYSPAERSDFAQRAETLLQEVGNNSSYPGLRVRALLWHAVTLQTQYTDFPSLKTAVDTLSLVGEYRDSRVYNDSVYYMGNVHAKMGWYGPARHYFKKINGLNKNGDDLIYDYTDKTFYTTSQASRAGLNRLRDYMDGTHEDYK